MIIRLTLVDNDFTGYLEEFCEGLRDKMFTMDGAKSYDITRENYDSVESYCEALHDFWDREKALYETRCYLMKPDNKFKKGSKEHKQIIEEVLRLWKIYASTVDMERWTPNVSIQYELKEQWENGEVVYYWTPYDKFITQ